MKIQGQYPKVPIQDKNTQKLRDGDVEARKGVGAKASEELHQGEKQQFAVNRLREKINAEPDIDAEKVARLKEQIKQGKYQVDAVKTANNLVKSALFEDLG